MRWWREGEQLRIHRRHMWSVPAAHTSSLAVSDSAAVIPSDDGFYKVYINTPVCIYTVVSTCIHV